jgi:O-antigen biosynthesis protein
MGRDLATSTSARRPLFRPGEGWGLGRDPSGTVSIITLPLSRTGEGTRAPAGDGPGPRKPAR